MNTYFKDDVPCNKLCYNTALLKSQFGLDWILIMLLFKEDKCIIIGTVLSDGFNIYLLRSFQHQCFVKSNKFCAIRKSSLQRALCFLCFPVT